MASTTSSVGSPIPATAVVVDLRGFTAELNETRDADGSRARFCSFLAEMNEAIITCATLALPPELRDQVDRYVHIGTTGDGALIVFLHPDDHVRHAVLGALVLRRTLERDCQGYSARSTRHMDFGIGIETGNVRSVGAEGPIRVATVIGRCINLAARIQDLTKTIARTHVVLGPTVVDELLALLHAEDSALVRQGYDVVPVSDVEYLETEGRRFDLNRRLCLKFLHQHQVRGFAEPRSLFRLSMSSAVLGNPRFEAMLHSLTAGDQGWLEPILRQLD